MEIVARYGVTFLLDRLGVRDAFSAPKGCGLAPAVRKPRRARQNFRASLLVASTFPSTETVGRVSASDHGSGLIGQDVETVLRAGGTLEPVLSRNRAGRSRALDPSFRRGRPDDYRASSALRLPALLNRAETGRGPNPGLRQL